MAVNLQGFIRATMDLDLMISLDEGNVRKFIEAVREGGYRPRAPVSLDDFGDPAKRREWIEGKNMRVFSVYNPCEEYEQVDVLLTPVIDFSAAYERRQMVRVGDLEFGIASIDDLISLKQATGRERDGMDIRALQRIKELKHGQGSE